jgi:hypothetical protein
VFTLLIFLLTFCVVLVCSFSSGAKEKTRYQRAGNLCTFEIPWCPTTLSRCTGLWRLLKQRAISQRKKSGSCAAQKRTRCAVHCPFTPESVSKPGGVEVVTHIRHSYALALQTQLGTNQLSESFPMRSSPCATLPFSMRL